MANDFEMSLSFFFIVIHDCNKEIIELLLNHGSNAQCEDASSRTTALQMAVIRGNLNTTQLLVTHGADTRILTKVESEKKLIFLVLDDSFQLGWW